MEWYWVATIIVAFVGLVALWVYLGKKGIVSQELMVAIKTLVANLSNVFDVLANAAPSQTTTVLDKAWELLEMSVQAAENMWYNGEIEKEDRYQKCVDLFVECLRVYDIELPAEYVNVMDAIIRATCEAMGHSVEAIETTTENA